MRIKSRAMKYYEMIGLNEKIDIKQFSEHCNIHCFLTLCILTVMTSLSRLIYYSIDFKLSRINENNRQLDNKEQKHSIFITYSRACCKIFSALDYNYNII